MLLYRRDQRSMIYGIFCAFRYATRARDFRRDPLVIVEHARLFFFPFFLFFLFSFKEFLEITGAPRTRARLITQRVPLPMFFFSYLSANNKYLIDRRLYVALQ